MFSLEYPRTPNDNNFWSYTINYVMNIVVIPSVLTSVVTSY